MFSGTSKLPLPGFGLQILRNFSLSDLGKFDPFNTLGASSASPAVAKAVEVEGAARGAEAVLSVGEAVLCVGEAALRLGEILPTVDSGRPS